jgi:predicted regulator of Ras-like GTPase activity (Roadblock/LC7/MglB family)
MVVGSVAPRVAVDEGELDGVVVAATVPNTVEEEAVDVVAAAGVVVSSGPESTDTMERR